jgi:site-specific recombinase XerC
MGVIMDYLQNTRPKLIEYRTAESKKLFLPLPEMGKNKTDSEVIHLPCYPLNPAIKSIDKQFVDFQQVRTSLITHWIKTYGLRKAQYMAGHRSIVSTQSYVSNDLENLTCDINKLHPFNL